MTKLYMSHERFVAALKRIRAQIANGLKLDHVDSDQPGNKYTHCSWGLCSENAAQWPDAEDHLWPDQFEKNGRVAPLYLQDGDECPFAGPQRSKSSIVGCFYRCCIFVGRKKTPSRIQALRLYDNRIAEHRSD